MTAELRLVDVDEIVRRRTAGRRTGLPRTLLGWLTSTDHKAIGIAYAVTALVFLAIGGALAGVIRTELRRRRITAVPPAKTDHVAARKRRGSAGGRPHDFDAEAYKDRNVVERSFNKAKQWRGLATRYDKLAITDRAAATIFAVITWLRT